MMFLFPPGLLLLFLGLWYYRRGSTLTRACRWREARQGGAGHWRCAACGAECDLAPGRAPRHCLRQQ
ncbi:hypothetical protein [Pseudogemmobacter humi]|uniref:Uncharacterized protein n=1 Tax=Pseudogemmobacter humi TaxID=2483812 RepID=A0A3P5X9Z0_9RHOB|nr:hypothetical protein [Pseudogemmobacter humi]VDC25257.1 hypothetical protein XINFAN_01495 [Pseudogemmobacter humi]